MTLKKIQDLLGQLCVTYGYCVPPLAAERLMANPPTTVDTFTHAILEAEGCTSPYADPRAQRTLRAQRGDAATGVKPLSTPPS